MKRGSHNLEETLKQTVLSRLLLNESNKLAIPKTALHTKGLAQSL
jgi:hypothetical protein